jgi:peptidoglycan/LPS O-acetylase OafA/YrhL
MPAPANESTPLHDIPSLTGLRFLAALSVAVAHAAGISLLSMNQQGAVQTATHWLEVGAGFGMTLFFVLSGFVIHYNYSQKIFGKGLNGVAKFFWARFARLYPLYFLILFIELIFSDVAKSILDKHLMPDRIYALPAVVDNAFLQQMRRLKYIEPRHQLEPKEKASQKRGWRC